MEKEKKLTLKQFEKDVLKVNGTQKIEEAEQIGVLLLASIQEGVDNDKLEAFTHYPWPVVKKTTKWLKDSGTYTKDGKFRVDWFKKEGGVALICDTLCVLGLMEKKIS